MYFETKRLFLRPWQEEDAEDLYRYAKDPQVGPAAGWPVHTSVSNSRETIRNVLARKGNWAVLKKDSPEVIGCVGLKTGADSELNLKEKEGEIGCWLGVPFWGQGLIPEAVERILQYAFEDLAFTAVWYAYYQGNEKSKRVQEKCGFTFAGILEDQEVPLLGERRTVYVSKLTREEWKKRQ